MKIGDIPITDNGNGSFTFTVVHTRIDGDGSGPSHGDPDYQPDTSLHRNGGPLNADIDPYAVACPELCLGVKGIVLGCRLRITNKKNGKWTWSTFGDVGPHSKLGELAIIAAKLLGIPSSPTTGGDDGTPVEYTFWPGIAADHYELQPYRR